MNISIEYQTNVLLFLGIFMSIKVLLIEKKSINYSSFFFSLFHLNKINRDVPLITRSFLHSMKRKSHINLARLLRSTILRTIEKEKRINCICRS